MFKLNNVRPITKAAKNSTKNNKETKQKQYNSNKKTRNINKVLGQVRAESVSKK